MLDAWTGEVLAVHEQGHALHDVVWTDEGIRVSGAGSATRPVVLTFDEELRLISTSPEIQFEGALEFG